ncbi:MAG: restriction endonuclease subunit S [Chloroflexi bacterium]|nr:restriction endonuclease subunit S [Chloroflexota bacterium]
MVSENWTIKSFAEIARYSAGRTPARATPEYWMAADDSVPWVAISDMTEFGLVSQTKERISGTAFDEIFGNKAVPAGTLLMSFKLTIGRIATLGVDACHNEAIIAIYPHEGVNQSYLGYFLSQVDYDALQDRQVKGNTLNRNKIDRIQVLLPPQSEQVRIAEFLDHVRRSIDLQDQSLATAQALKRAAMHTLFTRGLRGEPQKETEIGPVPESWEPVAVNSVAVVKGGKRMPKGVALTSENTGQPYIRVTDFRDHRVDAGQVLFVPDGYKSVIARYTISSRDVYISIAGTIGLVGQISESLDGANLTENAAKVSVTDERVTPRFLMYALASDTCQTQIAQSTATNAQPKLALVRIEQLQLPIPPKLDEQREVVAILDAIDHKIDLHRRKRAMLEELFKALLHKLMTGGIRAADLDLSAMVESTDFSQE